MKKLTILLATVSLSAQAQSAANYPPDLFENGHILLDVLAPKSFSSKNGGQKVIQPKMYAEDQALVKKLGLTEWKPNYKFKAPAKSRDAEEPWVGKNLDVRHRGDAERIAQILLKYILDGWFEGKVDLSANDTHFRQNNFRTWCHTPWMNVSESGREAIHGLTKEFPLIANTVYPDVPAEIEAKKAAVTWGSSFFNQKVCRAYGKFFQEENLLTQLRAKQPRFETPQGGMGFKLLFSTMPDWRTNMPSWNGAYNWHAHISNMKKNKIDPDGDESIRAIKNIPLVQIDISLRDDRLKGTDPALKNWLMVSFYYDKDYYNESLGGANVPEAFKHMRPFGLQYGLGVGESFIFFEDGARNNHRPGFEQGDKTELPYHATRLNGPVDNTVSSCMGCHAQSGMNIAMPQGQVVSGKGLGFLTNEEYLSWKAQLKGFDLDFNMQADKAMRNFAASKKKKINGEVPTK